MYVYIYISLSLSISLYIYLYIYLYISTYLSYIYLSYIYLSISISLPLSLSLARSLSLSHSLYISLSLSLYQVLSTNVPCIQKRAYNVYFISKSCNTAFVLLMISWNMDCITRPDPCTRSRLERFNSIFYSDKKTWTGMFWLITNILYAFQWRHNERDCVSNHKQHDCCLNRVFGFRSKKKPQRSAPLAFVMGIHRWPVNCP